MTRSRPTPSSPSPVSGLSGLSGLRAEWRVTRRNSEICESVIQDTATHLRIGFIGVANIHVQIPCPATLRALSIAVKPALTDPMG